MTTFLPFFYLKQLISFSFNISKQIKTHFVYFNRHYYPIYPYYRFFKAIPDKICNFAKFNLSIKYYHDNNVTQKETGTYSSNPSPPYPADSGIPMVPWCSIQS